MKRYAIIPMPEWTPEYEAKWLASLTPSQLEVVRETEAGLKDFGDRLAKTLVSGTETV